MPSIIFDVSAKLTRDLPRPGQPAIPIESPGAERIQYLDGWRGVSLICVLIGHFFLRNFNIAQLGVELFFVLSGRLMAEILFIEETALPKFYRRRFSRIFPAMTCFVLLIFVATMDTPLQFKPAFILTALTFTYNYATVFGHRAITIDHVWSLCVEEHAYVLLGIIAFVSRRYKWRPLPIIFALAALSMADGVLSCVILKQDWFKDYWRTDTHVASILMSVVIYLAIRQYNALDLRKMPSMLPLVCVALGASMFLNRLPWAASYTVGTTLLALGVCTLDGAGSWFLRALSSRVLTWVGMLSYSFYLWQQPFYWTALLNKSGALERGLLLAGAIVCGILSFYLLERPARKFLNRTLGHWQPSWMVR
jgi:peptidoglycan/LPS O-acetylase OafA/YrhL